MQQVGAERLEHIISRSDDNLSMQRELNSQALLTIEGMSSSKIALTEAAEKLTDGMGRAGELAAAMQELLEADHNLLGELSSERVAMQSINNGYFEKMNNQVLQLQDDLNSEITNLLSRFTDIYSVTFENIEEQTGSLIESFDSQTRSLMDSLDEQVRDLTFLTKDVTAEIADLNKNLKDSTSEFASNVNSSLNGHLSSLDSSVNELMTKLASTTELIRESVDDLPAAVLLARMSIDKASDSDSVEDSD
jgi:archaellum component FlaC